MIQTSRLILTPLTVADLKSVYYRYTHPALCAYYTKPPISSWEETADFILKITKSPNQVFNIKLKDNADCIGDCALHDWDELAGTIELGGSLLPEYWGMGIMQEALVALMNYSKLVFGVNSIILKTTKQNKQAIRIANKLGCVLITEIDEELIFKRIIN